MLIQLYIISTFYSSKSHPNSRCASPSRSHTLSTLSSSTFATENRIHRCSSPPSVPKNSAGRHTTPRSSASRRHTSIARTPANGCRTNAKYPPCAPIRHPSGSARANSACRAATASADARTNGRSAGSSGASARCGGRGAHIWSESSAVVSAGWSAGDAQTRPRRCPGMQYDLENENRWMSVVRHAQSTGRSGALAGCAKSWCGGPVQTKSR